MIHFIMITRYRDVMNVLNFDFFFFFFNDTATTEIYTLSLHDALPIYSSFSSLSMVNEMGVEARISWRLSGRDRKSTRLNSSHLVISYAVFCLKKKILPSPVLFI